MLTVALGLVAALIFGAADFFGGLASKRISVLKVTAITAAAGLVVLLAATPFFGGEWSWSAVLLGGLSGVTGAAAISLLYASLALGPMSILSPLTAVVSALLPMLVGQLRGERFLLIGYVAIGLAFIAVVLVGFVPEKDAVRPSAKALAMAVGSGIMIGAFMIIIDLTPDDSGLVPLILNRAVNAAIMATVIGVLALVAWRKRSRLRVRSASRAAAGRSGAGWRGAVLLAVTGGVIDAVANALLLLGLRIGDLTVMSVLTALYPAGTIILAAIVLRERIARIQIIGLVLALAAAGMLALA
jgi:drug/metabolite transporter (DMT)-like permease